MAVGPENTVYAHNDDYGIVYQVRLDEGEVVRAFALGDPTIERDFEGIEVVGERVYLLTRQGRIYDALIGENKTRVKYNADDTRAGDFCETDGLTLGPPADDGSATFLILCKTPKRKTPKEKVSKDRVRIYRWSLHARRPVQTPWLDVAREDLKDGKPKNFTPSGLAWSQEYQQLFIISAKAQRYASLRRGGQVLQKSALPKKTHPQAEGITITPAGDLVIADEAQRNNAPQLTLYAAAPKGLN